MYTLADTICYRKKKFDYHKDQIIIHMPVEREYDDFQLISSVYVCVCTGVRQQENILSAYIDGSNVYGADDDEMNALRSFSGGESCVTRWRRLPTFYLVE